jgi:hypothetical protein
VMRFAPKPAVANLSQTSFTAARSTDNTSDENT